MTETIAKSIHDTHRILRNQLDRIKPILDVAEPFTVKDIEGGKNVHSTLQLLHENSAIKIVGSEVAKEKHYINKWEWVEPHKSKLQSYIKERTTFPNCDHRIAIYNDPELPEDRLGCKKCAANGKHPSYSKETVRDLL